MAWEWNWHTYETGEGETQWCSQISHHTVHPSPTSLLSHHLLSHDYHITITSLTPYSPTHHPPPYYQQFLPRGKYSNGKIHGHLMNSIAAVDLPAGVFKLTFMSTEQNKWLTAHGYQHTHTHKYTLPFNTWILFFGIHTIVGAQVLRSCQVPTIPCQTENIGLDL